MGTFNKNQGIILARKRVALDNYFISIKDCYSFYKLKVVNDY